jgi:hypothetical protein
MVVIGPAERHPTDDQPVVGKIEEFSDEWGVRGQRRLGNRAETEAVCGQQERLKVEPAVDRAIGAEFSFCGDDRGMGCAEELEVLRGLFRRPCPVTLGDADAFVELEAAFTSPLEMDTRILLGEREVGGEFGGSGVCGEGGPEALRAFAFGDDYVPWLRVAL